MLEGTFIAFPHSVWIYTLFKLAFLSKEIVQCVTHCDLTPESPLASKYSEICVTMDTHTHTA